MPTDKERLDWVEENKPSIHCDENLIWTLSPFPKHGIEFYFKNSFRDVVDEAMKAEEKNDG